MTRTRALSDRDGLAPEILILLSGGIDSAACVDFYKKLRRPICALHVEYGQSSAAQERHAAERIAAHYDLPLHRRRLALASIKFQGEIRGRNAFLVLTAIMECPASIRAIALGIHLGTGYADCSGDFLNALNRLIQAHGYALEVLAPFVSWCKEDVLSYCARRRVPLHLTYSCEAGGDVPCTRCRSCLDRRGIDARS